MREMLNFRGHQRNFCGIKHEVRHNDVPGTTMKSSISFLGVEGFFCLWQNVPRFPVILCHGLNKKTKFGFAKG
jgi:hypothetical protein